MSQLESDIKVLEQSDLSGKVTDFALTVLRGEYNRISSARASLQFTGLDKNTAFKGTDLAIYLHSD